MVADAGVFVGWIDVIWPKIHTLRIYTDVAGGRTEENRN